AGAAAPDARAAGESLGPGLAGPGSSAQPGHLAADDRPVPGNLRVRCAAHPVRLPRAPLGRRAVGMATPRAAVVAASAFVAGRPCGGPRVGGELAPAIPVGPRRCSGCGTTRDGPTG